MNRIEPPDVYEIEFAIHKVASDYGDVSRLARAMNKNRSVVSRQLNPDTESDNPIAGCCLYLYGFKKTNPPAFALAQSILEDCIAQLNGRGVGEQTADELVREIGELAARVLAKARELPAEEQMVLVSRIYGAVSGAMGQGTQVSRTAGAG